MSATDAIELAGVWRLTDESGAHAIDMALPGDGISALHKAGSISDPYWGRNEYDLRWIADRDWSISRNVSLEDTNLDLVMSGADVAVTVRLNGVLVLQTLNAFRSYRADLSQAARRGQNEMTITFHSTTRAANSLQQIQPFPIPYSASNNPIPNGNMLRKMQCDFGWDWNIALAPFGIYGALRFEPRGRARIERLAVRQEHGQGRATVRVTAHVQAADGADYAITFAGESLTGIVAGCTVSASFTVETPELWWPAGQGAQVLHDLSVRVGAAHETRRIGLRRIELITEKDAAGLGFKFRVNGRDIFARGANWIPADALAGRINSDDVRDLLQSAVDANMNMIRVWGGGRYEPDWFYDICDELGLMVWQDFMFACSLYPSTPDFLTEVDAEVRENVARMHHHACLALWCGDNELIGALSWFEESRKDRDRYLVNYDRLNRCIEAAMRAVDQDANWWPSSPSPGPMNFGDAWHEDSAGDMHFWSVWHEGRDFDHYRDVSPRFCSEFGFQSYPSMDVIRRFAAPADFNIASPVMESHQKNAGGNARIAETMFRYFRFPVDFESFVYLSQVQQGLAIKTAVTHWRSLKPHCMGALIWQLNDTWPVCSWSSLDHGGGWKLLHHMASRFFAPVCVCVVPRDNVLVLRGVNDLPSSTEITLEAFATDMKGQTRTLGKATSVVGDATVELMRLDAAALQDDEMLSYVWQGSDGTASGDVFAPKPYKHYNLLPPKLGQTITSKNGVWLVTVSAASLALFVSVEASVPGRFNTNAIAISPGHDVTITFTPADPKSKPQFTLRDLHSATY
jgi:beta-mannosidase